METLNKKPSWKERRRQKIEKRDLERYGIKPTDLKRKSSKTNWKALRACLGFFKPYKWAFVGLGILAVLFAILAVFKPIIMENMVTEISQLNISSAINLALWFMVIGIATHVVLFFWSVINSRAINGVVRHLRSSLMDNIFRTKTKRFDLVNSGELISRINSDTTQLSTFVSTVLDKFSGILKMLGLLAYFFVLNIWLGLLVLGTIALFTVIDTIYQNYRQKMRRRIKHLSDKNIGLVSEIVRSVRDVKALNIKKNLGQKYEDNINNMATASIDNSTVSAGMRNIINSLLLIADFALIVLGILFMANGLITIGALIVFLFYKNQAMMLIEEINLVRDEFKHASLSAERLAEIFDDEEYPKEKFGNKKLKKPQGQIEFKDVSFAYNETTSVLKNFNLTIPANKTFAFVGKSGHGKSTLINLIPRLYEVQNGKILIDGVDATKLSEDALRGLVTIVPQTPYIFNTSIRENLQLVKPDLTEDEMISACKAAQIHDFIMSKDDGYDSIVGENGVILSGGQKQRLAIARALLKNAKIILLDEATSALDNESQAQIKEALDQLSGTHTIIIVAHRLSTVVDADSIVVLENGQIMGQGTHEELLLTCKEYKSLYKEEKTKK